MSRARVTSWTSPRLERSRLGSKATTTEECEPASATMITSLESLVGLRWFDGPDMRPTLLRVLTDLYVQKPTHSAEEEQQYVELSLRLLDAVDVRARMEAARKLSTYEGAPPA